MADRTALEWGWASPPGELSKIWPRHENGESVAPKFLKHCSSGSFEDTMLLNMLESFGIPAFATYPGDGGFGKVVLGMSGTGSCIFVPETMYNDAIAIMEAEPDDELQS